MGVIYTYYKPREHVEFEMGKWYGWSQEEASRVLMLARDEMISALREYISTPGWNLENANEYAGWLADRLIAFRGDSPAADVRWISEYDSVYDEPGPSPARVGSRYSAEYSGTTFIGDDRDDCVADTDAEAAP